MGRRRRALAPRTGVQVNDRLRTRVLSGAGVVAMALAPGLALAQLRLDAAATQVSAGGQAPLVSQSGNATDITLGASRTILTWSSYGLAADQSAVYRFQDKSWIVLNKVSGQATIDGQIEALVGTQRGAGNVWFQAPGGVIFGPNARVNVGGLLATPAAVGQAGFLDPSRFSFDFTGGGAAKVEMRAGADIRASGGALALIAGAIVTEDGSALTSTGGSSLLYGAAGDFTVRFSALTGDLDLLDFVVPPGGGTASTTPLTLRGQTVGSNVFLAVVNRAEVASAVINAPGLIAAQSASADRGDVVLAAGVSIVGRQPSLTRLNSTTELSANFGVVSAQRDLLVAFSSPTALSAVQLASGRDLGLSVASLDVGALNAGRLLAVDAARSLAVRSGASAGANASFRTGGALTIGGGSGAVNAVGRLQIDAGSVRAGQLNSGRSVVINASGAGANGGPAVSLAAIIADDDVTITTTNAAGHIVLGQVQLTSARADETPAGRNLILSARGAEADITYGAAGGSPVIGITRASFTAGRDVTVNAAGPLAIAVASAGRDLTVNGAGALSLSGAAVGRDLSVAASGAVAVNAASVGRDLKANVSGPLTVSGGAVGQDLTLNAAGPLSLSGTSVGRDVMASVTGPMMFSGASVRRDVTVTVAGLLTLGGGSAGRNAILRAGDLDITAPFTAASLRIESLQGGMTVGGGTGGSTLSTGRAAPADGLRLTDAEFQFLTVSGEIGLYAGTTNGAARGDLTVQTLHLDPVHTPSLLLAAGAANTISITGDLAPGTQGGVVTVGDPSAGSGWQPGRIQLTGSIGVAKGSTNTGFIDVHALGETHLNAVNEILLGSPRFIALVTSVPADQIDVANDKPAGVAATAEELNHIWITTGILTMSASARILMQNTGTKAQPNGIFIDETVPGAPTDRPPLSISTTGVVDLFGTFRDPGGVVHGGLGAGLTTGLQVTTTAPAGARTTGGGAGGGGTSGGGSGGGSTGGGTGGAVVGAVVGATIRFNGLDVTPTSSGGGGARGLPNLLDARLQTIAHGLDGALRGPSDAQVGGLRDEPTVLSPAGPDGDTIVEDIVQAGTGSYEIWRRKPKKPSTGR